MTSKSKFILLSFCCCFFGLASGQEVQRLFQETEGTPNSLGMVNPNEGLGGVSSVMHLISENDGTDSVFYSMSEIVFGVEPFIKSKTNLSLELPNNHHLLYHIVKDNRWYAFGYEQVDSEFVRYFVIRLEQNGNLVQLRLPFHYHSTTLKEKVKYVSNAQILSSSEIGFVGAEGDEPTVNRSLFFIFQETGGELKRVEKPSGTNIVDQTFPSDVFSHNDSIYNLYLYPLESSKPNSVIGVYSKDGSFVSSKDYGESISFPGRPSNRFANHVTHSQLGEGMVLIGSSVGRHVYYQEYDRNFALIFDRLFKLNKQEFVPFQDGFFPLSNRFGVVVSYSPLGFFGKNVNHDLILRLYDKVEDTVLVMQLEDENFSHLSGAFVVGSKILVAGFTSEKIEDEQENNVVYYLANYNEMAVGINDVFNVESGKIKLIPNPVVGGSMLNLSWSGIERQSWKVKFYDNQGRLVHLQSISEGLSEYNIKIPELLNGSYIIRAEGSKEVHTATLLVR